MLTQCFEGPPPDFIVIGTEFDIRETGAEALSVTSISKSHVPVGVVFFVVKSYVREIAPGITLNEEEPGASSSH